eukprot:SAG22_NODE_685_length_7917_cov_15.152852_6_plen_133_part_00
MMSWAGGAFGSVQADRPAEEPDTGRMGSEKAKLFAKAELDTLLSGVMTAVEEAGLDLAQGEERGGEGDEASRGDQILDADLEEELEAMLREQDELDREAGQGEQEEPDGEEGETGTSANVVDSSGLKDLMNK